MSSNFQNAFDMACQNTKWDKLAMYMRLENNSTASVEFAKKCAVKARQSIGEKIGGCNIGCILVEFAVRNDVLYCVISFSVYGGGGWNQ